MRSSNKVRPELEVLEDRLTPTPFYFHFSPPSVTVQGSNLVISVPAPFVTSPKVVGEIPANPFTSFLVAELEYVNHIQNPPARPRLGWNWFLNLFTRFSLVLMN